MLLHGEGEVAAPAAPVAPAEVAPSAPSQPAEPSVQQHSEPTESSGESGEASRPKYKIEVDPRTNRRSVVTINYEDETSLQNTNNGVRLTQTREQEAKVGGGQQQNIPVAPPARYQADANGQPLFAPPQAETQAPKAPAPYQNAGELIQALQSGNVDESRIPMELAIQYASFKQQMLQQQQAVAQQQRASNENAPAEQQSPTQQQEDIAEARRQFYTRVEDMAKSAALADVGLTEDQLITAEYSDDAEVTQKANQYNAALAWHRSNILANVQQEQAQAAAQKQAQENILNDIRSKVVEYSRTEPNFNDINIMMNDYYKSMPYKDAVRYAEAINAFNSGNITEQQAVALQDYYNSCRTAYYANKHNLGVGVQGAAVPRVETAGSGVIQSAPAGQQVVTAADLAKATDYRQRREIIGKLIAQRAERRNLR